MFHKYNSFTNTLIPSDQISAYTPQGFGTKEATNNYFIAPQPKGRQPGGSGPDAEGSIAGRQMTIFRFFTRILGFSSSASASNVQTVASTLSQTAAASIQAVSQAASQVTSQVTNQVASHGTSHAVSHGTSHAASHGTKQAVQSHGHGHGAHAAPWEGVNLWRTPYKGDSDTITHVKRNKGTLDQYVERRTRNIQQLQLLALRKKHIPTWVMMPRDKMIFAVQGVIAVYVLYQVGSSVYQHLKAKDRLKLIKLLYKDNVD